MWGFLDILLYIILLISLLVIPQSIIAFHFFFLIFLDFQGFLLFITCHVRLTPLSRGANIQAPLDVVFTLL